MTARYDHGDAELAHHRVGPGCDRDGRDRRVFEQDRLDLERVHVVAAAYVHLADAAGDAQPPGLVDRTEVTGSEPSVGVERA